MQAYCVKCRTQRDIQNETVTTNDKGRRMAKGKCAVCGTNLTRFLPSK
jgi:hypothetical protein